MKRRDFLKKAGQYASAAANPDALAHLAQIAPTPEPWPSVSLDPDIVPAPKAELSVPDVAKVISMQSKKEVNDYLSKFPDRPLKWEFIWDSPIIKDLQNMLKQVAGYEVVKDINYYVPNSGLDDMIHDWDPENAIERHSAKYAQIDPDDQEKIEELGEKIRQNVIDAWAKKYNIKQGKAIGDWDWLNLPGYLMQEWILSEILSYDADSDFYHGETSAFDMVAAKKLGLDFEEGEFRGNHSYYTSKGFRIGWDEDTEVDHPKIVENLNYIKKLAGVEQ
jgi:hypothetical protein